MSHSEHGHGTHHATTPQPMAEPHAGHGSSRGHSGFFEIGSNAKLLFEDLHISTTAGMIGACLVLFLLGIIYEVLKATRVETERRFRSQQAALIAQGCSPCCKSDAGSYEQVVSRFKNKPWISNHAIQTLLYFVQVILSYVLMLVVMSYNVWLCVSVVLGLTTGYFLFGWRALSESVTLDSTSDHCQ